MKNPRLMFVKFMYQFGTFMDFISAIEMFASAFFGIQSPFVGFAFTIDGDYLYRYAMLIGAVFMLGWTILLAWGFKQPIQRRGILLITAFSVMPGLFLSQILLIIWNVKELNEIIFTMIIQGIIFLMLLISYYLAHKESLKEIDR